MADSSTEPTQFVDRRQLLSLENSAQGLPDVDRDRQQERRFASRGFIDELEFVAGLY